MARDTVYAKQCTNTKRRLRGKNFRGKLIVEVGIPSDARLNAPTLVPVKFLDGTYGIIWNEKEGILLSSDNPDAEKAIARSRKMPKASPGVGSDVVWVTAYPRNSKYAYAAIRVFYNHKAGRGDKYTPVTHAEASQLRRSEREAREEQEEKDAA